VKNTLFINSKLKTNMVVHSKCNVGGDLNAILSLLEKGIKDDTVEETDSDSSSDESVGDAGESDTSDDDQNSDPPSQPCVRLNLRNLKWVSKLNKPTGKCGFTGQLGINATVNDSLELLELSITDELVEPIVKETNRYADMRYKFC
jgi:hypothetical protein